MARVFSSTNELTRQHGSQSMMLLTIQHASGNRYLSDRTIRLSDLAFDIEPRVIEWGSLDQQLEPERVGGFGSAQIKIQDSDDSIAELFAKSPGIQATICELAILYWEEDGNNAPQLQTWSNRTIIDRGTFSAPSYDAKQKIWSCEFRNLSSYYDRSVGFRVDQNAFADLRCTAEEGKIIPIPFGARVFRVEALMIERPGQDAIGEAILEIHDETFDLINDGGNVAFDTSGATKTYYIGYQYNYEVVTGFFDDADNSPKTITISTRGSILTSGNSAGRFASGGFQFFTINKDDIEQPTIPRIGHPYWIYVNDAWKGLIVTQWKIEGDVIIIGYLGEFSDSAGIGTAWKLGRWPGYIPRWPPGTPVYEEGDWVYALSHLPIEELHRMEAKASIQTPGGGQPDAQWYSMDPDTFDLKKDNRDYNTQLGRTANDPGLTTVTVERPPTTYGFEDNRLFATMNGILHNGSTAASTASQIIKTIAQSKWLGNFHPDHVDEAVLNASGASIPMAFAITEERKIAELFGEIAFNGGCGVFWDQGIIQCKVWPLHGGGGYSVNPDNTIGFPKHESLNLEDIFTEAVGIFRPYASSKEYRYLRKSQAAIDNIGRRVKELEFRMLQRPTSVATALNHWFHWYLNTHVKVDVDGLTPSFLINSLLDSISVNWSLPESTTVAVDGVLTRTGTVFPDAKANKHLAGKMTIYGNLWPYTIDDVDDPKDDECEPPPGNIPTIEPGWGQPITQGEVPAGNGILEE